MTYKSDDIALLLPTWRAKVSELMFRMGELGFKPVLFDGLRTAAEAQHNAETGHGIADSVHCYGAAADLICNLHGWDCGKHGCKFYTKLGQEAEQLGMVWGGRFSRCDQPHVQGVAVAQQKQLRELGTAAGSAAARDALVAAHFKASGHANS